RYASLRRVLRAPERWGRIVELARACGESLPATADAPALSYFLAGRERAAPDRFQDVSLSIVKLRGSAEYVRKRPGEAVQGHVGLAVDDYTHATAPNRRFPDLVTQRLVKAALAGRPSPYGEEELRELAAHCTEQEGNAAKVERQVHKSAAAMLLESRTGAQFDAMVTGASDKGVWVRILQPLAEGRLVSAQGAGPADPAAAQSSTAQPSTIPSTEPGPPSTMGRQSDPSSPQSDPATTAQAGISSASENTRLAAIVPAGMSTQEACT